MEDTIVFTRNAPTPGQARDDGFYACQNMPAGVRGRAGHAPDSPRAFAVRLRIYVHLQLRDDPYRPAFEGCLKAVWSKRLGLRPRP